MCDKDVIRDPKCLEYVPDCFMIVDVVIVAMMNFVSGSIVINNLRLKKPKLNMNYYLLHGIQIDI